MNDETTHNDTPAPPETSPPRPRHRRPAQAYDAIDDAAARLGMTAQALRARCRRGAVREGREVRCYLGDGVVATKFGRTWRVRFPHV
jgi:hypothetical protein